MAKYIEHDGPEFSAGTLGNVLYAGNSSSLEAEEDWVRLVRSVAAGDQLALHALYDRAHRVVFTLIMRITGKRESAEALTLDVFLDVWRRAPAYDAGNGTVLAWIMNQARARALHGPETGRRKQGVNPDRTLPPAGAGDFSELKRQSAVLQRALAVLTPDERRTIEAAYFSDLSHAEVATDLQQPLAAIRTRIRSGLHKLRLALAAEARKR